MTLQSLAKLGHSRRVHLLLKHIRLLLVLHIRLMSSKSSRFKPSAMLLFMTIFMPMASMKMQLAAAVHLRCLPSPGNL
jgi:hypothetical protein